jgi:hypothetical protein
MEVDNMRIVKPLLFICLAASVSSSQPVITPTDFLNTLEPERMCQDYIDFEFGDTTLFLAHPSGGALIRADLGDKIRCLYIFCDHPFNRLIIFSLDDDGEERKPNGIKAYGRQLQPANFQIDDGVSSFTAPYQGQDSAECFLGPVDIVSSSKHDYYNAAADYIYVIDQGNHRIVRLRYDVSLDSLIWVDTFGSDILNMPTAIDYAPYGDTDPDNDDVFVADGVHSKIFRFSRDGYVEMTYGGWGSSIGSVGYPTGIAMSAVDSLSDILYLTDSRNHRVMRYSSSTDGPIVVDSWYVFPLDEHRYVKAVDTDLDGNVYVIDNFTHLITVFTPDLGDILTVYGSFGYDPGLFDHPFDIYIDDDQMQICEKWGEQSGIQSFSVQPGQPKPAEPGPPRRFFLDQNYPNPFNSNTIINFDLPRTGDTRLVVYNILGQRVAVLVDQTLPAGSHSIRWDGRNSSGNRIASGVYFYLLTSGNHNSVRKLLLIK